MAPEDKFDYFRKVSKAYGQKKKAKERVLNPLLPVIRQKRRGVVRQTAGLKKKMIFLKKSKNRTGPENR